MHIGACRSQIGAQGRISPRNDTYPSVITDAKASKVFEKTQKKAWIETPPGLLFSLRQTLSITHLPGREKSPHPFD